MAANYQESLLMLNFDVLRHIFSFLDIDSLSTLPLTCQSVRDLIYGLPLWRDAILCVSSVNESTARSIQHRNINTLSVDAFALDNETVGKYNAIETMKNLIIGSKDSSCIDIRHGLPEMPSIRCLISVHQISDSYDERSGYRFEIEEGLMYALPAFSNLRELHIYELDNGDHFFSPRALHSIADNLPLLIHFEFDSHYGQRRSRGGIPISMYGDDYDGDGHCLMPYMPSDSFKHLERMAGVQLSVSSSDGSDIATLAQNLPKVKHLKLGRGSEFDFSYLDEDERRDEVNQLITVESLEFGIPSDGWSNIALFLMCLPNLTALALTCSESQTNSWPIDFGEGLGSLAKFCPKLSVLKITGFQTSFPGKSVRRIVRDLKSLTVLILFPSSDRGQLVQPSDEFVSDLLENGKSLRSLLDNSTDASGLDTLPNLQFKSSNDSPVEVEMRSTSTKWLRLTEYTSDWYEAQGTSYFYPEDSKPNIKFTEHVREHLLQEAGHPCVDGGTARRRKRWTQRFKKS